MFFISYRRERFLKNLVNYNQEMIKHMSEFCSKNSLPENSKKYQNKAKELREQINAFQDNASFFVRYANMNSNPFYTLLSFIPFTSFFDKRHRAATVLSQQQYVISEYTNLYNKLIKIGAFSNTEAKNIKPNKTS